MVAPAVPLSWSDELESEAKELWMSRMMFVIAVAAMVATYASMMIWWGLPARYGAGEAVNIIAGWLLVLLVIDRVVFGKRVRLET